MHNQVYIHIPPNGRNIITSRIKSVKLPNQHLIYIANLIFVANVASEELFASNSDSQKAKLYRRRLESNSSGSIKVSATKIASLRKSAVTSLITHCFKDGKKPVSEINDGYGLEVSSCLYLSYQTLFLRRNPFGI